MSRRLKNKRKKKEEVDRMKRMSIFGLRIETRDEFDENSYEDFKNIRREIKDKSHSYRIGPAPVTDYDTRPNHYLANYPGRLDGEVNDVDLEKQIVKTDSLTTTSKAGCRGLIMYFAKLGQGAEMDGTIDLEFVDSLLKGGADINFPDRHGQTCMHEISRGWHTDVSQFVLSRGADIDKGDNYGRTPLHLAAAVNYPEMVFWLVNNGAKIDSRTVGEHQTPIHYAAKNNAEDALKVLLHLGGSITDTDYKNRTPLFVAAETGRSEACKFLLEQGSPAGIYDDGGTSAMTLMVEKMPDVAKIALGQFQTIDKALRKKYYYLNYLELDVWQRTNLKSGKETRPSFARTPLETICDYNETDLIMHPVILRLIAMKWQLFGKYHTAVNTGINLIYTILWTILGVTMPKSDVKNYYTPIGPNSWRIVLELIALSMAFYFIVTQFFEFRRNERRAKLYKIWKNQEIQRDLQYCHERWPEEQRYLNSEMKMIKNSSGRYFQNGWNIFEICTNTVMALVVFSRIISSAAGSDVSDRIHNRSFPILLILLWLRFMRSCQCYQSLGPFITMLGHVITDTLKFTFLFFEFFIPYVCAFWILFGGQPGTQFEHFNDVVYQVFLMTLVDEYERDDIMKHDKAMAQVLVGSYLAIASVVCVNLYIALMSQTFTRVYQNAKATAFMQQANHLLKIEGTLGTQQKLRAKTFMESSCSPQVMYDTGNNDDDDNDSESRLMMYRMFSSVTEIKDKVLVLMMNTGVNDAKAKDEKQTSLDDVVLQVETVKKQCDKLESQIDDLKELLTDTKSLINTKDFTIDKELATVDDIKEIMQQLKITKDDDDEDEQNDGDKEGWKNDMITRIVEAVNLVSPPSASRSSKNSRREASDGLTPNTPLRSSSQQQSFDHRHEESGPYRSYSSDSISEPHRPQLFPQRNTGQDPYLVQNFHDFHKFQNLDHSHPLSPPYGYNYPYPHQYAYQSLPHQKRRQQSQSSYFQSKRNYDTDDGLTFGKSRRSRTMQSPDSGSLKKMRAQSVQGFLPNPNSPVSPLEFKRYHSVPIEQSNHAQDKFDNNEDSSSCVENENERIVTPPSEQGRVVTPPSEQGRIVTPPSEQGSVITLQKENSSDLDFPLQHKHENMSPTTDDIPNEPKFKSILKRKNKHKKDSKLASRRSPEHSDTETTLAKYVNPLSKEDLSVDVQSLLNDNEDETLNDNDIENVSSLLAQYGIDVKDYQSGVQTENPDNQDTENDSLLTKNNKNDSTLETGIDSNMEKEKPGSFLTPNEMQIDGKHESDDVSSLLMKHGVDLKDYEKEVQSTKHDDTDNQLTNDVTSLLLEHGIKAESYQDDVQQKNESDSLVTPSDENHINGLDVYGLADTERSSMIKTDRKLRRKQKSTNSKRSNRPLTGQQDDTLLKKINDHEPEKISLNTDSSLDSFSPKNSLNTHSSLDSYTPITKSTYNSENNHNNISGSVNHTRNNNPRHNHSLDENENYDAINMTTMTSNETTHTDEDDGLMENTPLIRGSFEMLPRKNSRQTRL